MLKKNSDICLHLEDEIASWGNKNDWYIVQKLLHTCYITDENIENKIKINQN